MLCLRSLRFSTLLSIRQLSKASGGSGGRNVVRNPLKFTHGENASAVKELEVPNTSADTFKPASPGVQAFVPRPSENEVRPKADVNQVLPSHIPDNLEGVMEQRGCHSWKQADGCLVCNLDLDLSYHNVALLYQFVTSTGTILGPRSTGLCQTSHQMLVNAIHASRDLGLMAYDYKPIEYSGAQLIVDIAHEKAGRPGAKDAGF